MAQPTYFEGVVMTRDEFERENRLRFDFDAVRELSPGFRVLVEGRHPTPGGMAAYAGVLGVTLVLIGAGARQHYLTKRRRWHWERSEATKREGSASARTE